MADQEYYPPVPEASMPESYDDTHESSGFNMMNTLKSIDWTHLGAPTYLSMATILLEIILLFAIKGFRGGLGPAFSSIIYGILTTYTISCLYGGKCKILAWLWALLPLTVTAFGLLHDYIYVEKAKTREGFNGGGELATGDYTNIFTEDPTGNEQTTCSCSNNCNCGVSSCCPPGKGNLDPIGSSPDKRFYRPREGMIYPDNSYSYYYTADGDFGMTN